ncbi:MAG: DNA-binding response regulator VicR [Candidatus Saccharibacteria bacterium]|nr:DNA-binding response regulator VicR [Candidatus Saccharibacteria bacterium]
MSNQKTVLIVEDEIVLQDVYKLILNSKGYNVVTANNGAEGISQLKKHMPDLVLLDVFMPVMDGKQFLRSVNLKDFPGTTVVVYTNLSDADTKKEVHDLGASDFVVKASMTPDDLIDMVAHYIG